MRVFIVSLFIVLAIVSFYFAIQYAWLAQTCNPINEYYSDISFRFVLASYALFFIAAIPLFVRLFGFLKGLLDRLVGFVGGDK